MFELRFRAVIERQDWDMPTWQRMEYDEFDNPATTYFVWRDEDDVVRGCSRLYPTDRPYMLKKVFSFLVTDGQLPESDMSIWEGSRICVEKDLPAPLRKRIIYELSVAYMEYAHGQWHQQDHRRHVARLLAQRLYGVGLGPVLLWQCDRTADR